MSESSADTTSSASADRAPADVDAWSKIIQAVRDPLGFFVLIALIVERV
jgi:hypothetical protein